MKGIEKFLTEVKRMLQKDKDVICAYLFGSRASGQETPSSDVDIAVYLKAGDLQFYLNKERELTDNLLSIFGTFNVDLVLLNVVPTLLKYRIIRDGRLINSKNEIERVNFETKVMLRYFDLKPHLDEYDHKMHERIKAGLF